MATNPSLPVSLLINVTSTLETAAVQGQGTNTLLILGSSPVINTTQRIAEFDSSTEVAQLFGANAPETAAATLYFEQNSAPLFIGRWAQTATSGQLFGSPLTPTQQAIAQWNAITDGGFTITIDGGVAEQVSPLNFAGAANLNGVAAVIQAKLTGATIVWSSINQQFVITSNTTGATSSVSFATAPTGEGVTDISAMLGLTATSSGVLQVQGIVAESALEAVTILDANFGGTWYALSILGAADADVTAVTAFLQGSSNKHFYQASTQETGVLVSTSTTDLASVLKASNVAKTAVQYNGSSPYSGISLIAKMLSVNYEGSNTVIAAMYQNEPGITADLLNVNQLLAATSKNCNVFVTYDNGASIIQPGICSNGQFIDTVIGADALSLAIQSAVFNYLLVNHVGQDDADQHEIKLVIQSVLQQWVTNGFIAPGVWNGPLFGTLQNNSDGTPPTLTKGYYVFQPPVASQPLAQLNQRISVPFQYAAILRGAVATVNVAGILVN